MMNPLENIPVLMCIKPLKTEFNKFEKLAVTSNIFTIGRGLQNSVVIPFISISRNHCSLKYSVQDQQWVIIDNSSFGVEINGHKLGKGISKRLKHGDIISLEPSGEFTYKFVSLKTETSSREDYETPKKRIKLEPKSPVRDNILHNVKIKFEESQSYEIRHIEDKIQNAKDMQKTSLFLKKQLQQDMENKMKRLEEEFANQIENLKGEKIEVERQKVILIEERDSQLTAIKEEMKGRVNELLGQIKKHNENETELLKENGLLKEKLMKEREEFLLELSRENTSKQDMLEKLEQKIKEQDEIRVKERKELEEALRQETEQLRLAKEKEFQELIELNQKRETELKEELDSMKRNLEEQLEITAQQKLNVQKELNEKMEMMKQLSNMETAKTEQLVKEREAIQKTLQDAQLMAQKSLEELQKRVVDRETELAALAADRIQKQAEQSGEVIHSLQEQLEKVKNQLQNVENENSLLKSLSVTEKNVNETELTKVNAAEPCGEGTSKQTTLTQVGEIIESELQCSICAELFVEATTLNCSHTYCKYCITMWKKKKKDCPICRAPITSECRSLVLDTFIEKMVQNLTEELKLKRQDILKHRAECETELALKNNSACTRRSYGFDESEYSDDSAEGEEGEEEDHSQIDFEDGDEFFGWPSGDSGSDYDSDIIELANSGGSEPGGAAPAAHAERGGRRRGVVDGIPGSYYGGYGRCFGCGARGHWAPGCPFK